MRTTLFSSLDELTPHIETWNRLSAGVPFRGWDWMSCWWKHYGRQSGRLSTWRLAVLGVLDTSDRLVGIAPWYLTTHCSRTRVLRWLGSGDVCSDYLTVLCEPSLEDTVAETLADYLVRQNAAGRLGELCWDRLEVDGVHAEDRPTARLLECLADRECLVHHAPSVNCWRIALPTTWDAYLAMLSRRQRSQSRRIIRESLDCGRAVLHSVTQCSELPRAVDLLIDLHQRRWRSLGLPGCFASERFTAFHRDVMPRLMLKGQLQLHWLELDGRPAAAEYHVMGNGVIYHYQGGVEPELLEQRPGRIANLAVIRRAIEQGHREMDFLRGDEPYKAQFGAKPRPLISARVIPDRAAARLRHQVWLAGQGVKRWAKSRISGAAPQGDASEPAEASEGQASPIVAPLPVGTDMLPSPMSLNPNP